MMIQFYSIFIFSLFKVSKGEMLSSQYKFTVRDYISENGILIEMDNIDSKILCASACVDHSACKGFGYNLIKTCYLFNIFMPNDYCSGENCLLNEGIKIYMVTSTFLCVYIF